MSSLRLRFVSLLLLVCLLATMPLVLSNDTTAQGSVPAGEYTPAFPDGPPVQIQPVSTVPPETPAGVPTEEPNPNEPPPTAEPNPNEPPPNEPPPPAPDEPDGPPPTDLPVAITPVNIPALPDSDEAVPIEVLPATITIRTRVCDNEGFNPYFTLRFNDLPAMEAECPLITDPFGFSIYTPAIALSKVTTGGVVAFDVPANTKVTLESVQPDGYDMPIYTCASPFQDRKWGEQTTMILPMSWSTQVAEAVECTWFFVQNSDDVNLELDKLNCPWFAPESLSTKNVFCDGGTLGTFGEVRLSDTNPATADLVRAAGSRVVSFIDLPPGTYTVTETGVSAGMAWSYWGHCYNADPADGSPDPTFPLVKSTSFIITLSEVGDTVRCTSTNVLKKSGSAGTSVPTATVKIKTAVCDNQGWDPYIRRPNSLAAYQAECTSPDPGFVFTLSQIGGTIQTKSTAGGEITFTVAGSGDHALLVQTLASGYSMPVVFCEDSLTPTVAPFPGVTDQAGFFPEAGTVYTCTFFNVLQTTDINLIIEGYTCPAAYDIDNPTGWGGFANPYDACGPSPGLQGTITLKDSDPATADQSVSSDGPPAVFLDLAPGTYSLTFTPKVAISSSFLFSCHAKPTDSGSVFTLTPLGKGPTVSIPLTQAGKSVTCNWFVVPKPVTSSGTFSFPLALLGAVGVATQRRR